MFALVGAAGAAAAPLAGRLGDRGWGKVGRLGAFVVAVAALVLGAAGERSVIALAVAGVLLDFAVQGHQVLSQRDIYALAPQARARVNTVYMTSVFLGGAISSVVSGAIDDAYGWKGVMIFAAVLPLLGVGLWWVGARRDETATADEPVDTAAIAVTGSA